MDGMTDVPHASPVAIDVQRAIAVTITWEDGHASRYELAALRRACPCAACRVERRAGQGPTVPEAVSIVDVKLAGNWGMTPAWSDGHHTGIYAWDYLRAECPCDLCTGLGND
jgi:DUF971 family protein